MGTGRISIPAEKVGKKEDVSLPQSNGESTNACRQQSHPCQGAEEQGGSRERLEDWRGK